ncbi:hypothetical protein WN944_015068 [Citrus x changshan-huyou]|uniref:Uncharacterized protein n=1 Tax=Citrus x changshan-huyou TaxID=2935761 RepID=A0AAP0MDA4_9ROSI
MRENTLASQVEFNITHTASAPSRDHHLEQQLEAAAMAAKRRHDNGKKGNSWRLCSINEEKRKMVSGLVERKLLNPVRIIRVCAGSGQPLVGRPDPLLDINGNEVEATRDYYVVSAIRGAGGGGLSLFKGRNGLCPFDVIQESSDLQKGTPLRFATYKNTSIIHEAMDLTVKFSAQTRCNELTVRAALPLIDDYDEPRGKWFITTGGVEGNPGPQTLKNWFKFQRSGTFPDTYKIVHCPSVCNSCVSLCENVGVSHEDGAGRLVLKADDELVFPIVIIPAKERSAKCES